MIDILEKIARASDRSSKAGEPGNFTMKIVGAAVLAICGAVQCMAQTSGQAATFFKEYIHLKDEQIASIEHGKPVVQVLPGQVPSEIAVFGAIYINTSPEDYLNAMQNVNNLRNSHNYLAIRQISAPPRLSDFEGFVFEDEDIKDLRNCKPGRCQVQLPVESIEEFQNAVDWSAADASAQVNSLAQRRAFEELIKYQKEGNNALGAYYDKEQPVYIIKQFETLVDQLFSGSQYLPDLKQYLVEYPRVRLPNAEDVFYWERVKFGLKPTLRLNHAIIYRDLEPSQQVNAIAVKQLYASHYFQTALDVSVCARDTRQQQNGSYLITIKASRQAGLTGPKGSLIRKAAVSRTCSSLESSLTHIKHILETGQGNPSAGIEGLQLVRAGYTRTDR